MPQPESRVESRVSPGVSSRVSSQFPQTRMSKHGSQMESKLSQSKKTVSRAKSPRFTNFMEKIKEMPTRIKEAPPKKFGKAGAAMVLGGVGFGWVVFPYALAFIVSKVEFNIAKFEHSN